MRQMVYLSTASNEYGETDLARILRSAIAFNEAHDITGMLAYGQGVFFQVLEGASEDVELVLKRVQHDWRHFGIKILDDRCISERDFPSWSMAFTAIERGVEIPVAGRLSVAEIPVVAARLHSPLVATFLKRFVPA